jgi:hypothetical protein
MVKLLNFKFQHHVNTTILQSIEVSAFLDCRKKSRLLAAKQVIFNNIKSSYANATSFAETSIAPGLAGNATVFGKSMR